MRAPNEAETETQNPTDDLESGWMYESWTGEKPTTGSRLAALTQQDDPLVEHTHAHVGERGTVEGIYPDAIGPTTRWDRTGTVCDATDWDALKVCRCCRREYDRTTWQTLPLARIGGGPNPYLTHDHEWTYALELRGCPCGNTLGVETRQPRETPEAALARWEQAGLAAHGCAGCAAVYAAVRNGHMPWNQTDPSHRASPRCQSGGHPHCTCDTCF